MRLLKCIALMGSVAVTMLPILSSGYLSLLASLPDKGENFGCATCHLSTEGGGPMNPSGTTPCLYGLGSSS